METFLSLGQFDDALEASEIALRVTPGHEYLLHVRARVLERMGRYDEALEASDRSIRRALTSRL